MSVTLARLRAGAAATAVLLFAALLTPPFAAATATVQQLPAGHRVVGQPCDPGVGVTMVVDFTALRDEVRIGCARGAQPNGLVALRAAGFTISSESGPGTVCRIDGLPTQGNPYCWSAAGGYWSYWHKKTATEWDFRSTSAGGTGTLPVDSVEGWSWAPKFDGEPPRVSPGVLPQPSMCRTPPTAPVLSIIDDDETLTFTGDAASGQGAGIETAVLTDVATPTADADFTPGATRALSGLSGPVRVLARWSPSACANSPVFDVVYDVRPTYSPRHSAASPQHPSPAVSASDPAIVGWATGHTDYVPGPNVNPTWQTPDNALGPVDSTLVVLGDHGHLTMTFDKPITDGSGADFAVYENGFGVTNGDDPLDLLELAYVEVSSDGRSFTRFASASRRAAPVGSFTGQSAAELGGLAGKDLSGWGTPFDLENLRHSPAVRSGALRLDRVTHVRIVDIVGDGGDQDSFGRPIYDPYPTVGSGGFDLSGIGVLHENQDPPPPAPSTLALSMPTTLAYGRAASATVRVSAAGTTAVTGAVTLHEGSRVLARASLSGGAASLRIPAGLAVGRHTLHASYAGSATVAAGTSTPRVIMVTKAPARATLKLARSSTTYGKGTRATVRVTLPGTAVTATGAVQLRSGTKVLVRKASLRAGAVTVTLPSKLSVGRHRISAVYAGSAVAGAAVSPVSRLVVGKAATRVTGALNKTRIRQGQRAKVRATVVVPGTRLKAGGKAVIRVGSRSWTTKLTKGTARVTLPRLRPGTYRVTITYRGTSSLHRSTSRPVKLRVVR
jgi:hypothetical protein